MRRSCSPFRCSFVSVVQHKFDVDAGNVSLIRACVQARVAGNGERKLKKQKQRINSSGEESTDLGGPIGGGGRRNAGGYVCFGVHFTYSQNY